MLRGHHPRPRCGATALGTGLLTVALLSGCTSDDGPEATAAQPTPAAAAPSGPPAIQPGRPGEPNTTGSPSIAPDTWSTADIEFASMMIPHHAQALEMSRLAPDRAQSPKVKAMAARIEAEQEPEIELFQAYLQERGQEVPPADWREHGHGHHSGGSGALQMAGMATEEELEALEAAEGTAFDKLFLQMMIRHHQGALTMIDEWGDTPGEVKMNEMASEVGVTQQGEINRMNDLLAEL
ncbi:DUF305 domain-containing protein [Motilibacter aurantiacus]|uniref:DUF305 domain-containing protein n=1 Tax=Motilibacter aurantiacus TaxID=2714955 RepID=UPI00140BC363|nr:DUF305 domain-containing protein [Motilibacter aurantiacus]NHC46587.1 DUF305 domain-containing protein [Motilibacter aurantiacus]